MKYTLQSWDIIKQKWQSSVTFCNSYRYNPIREEWERLVADAQNAQMPVRYRVINSAGTVYDLWERFPTN